MSEEAIPRERGFVSANPTVGVFLIIAAVVFISHFLLCSKFGIYEDDYIYVLPTFSWSATDWLHAIRRDVISPLQGRPLYYVVQETLSFFTTHGGNTVGGHLVSFVIVTINGFLMFRLLKRVLSAMAGFVGAIDGLLLKALKTTRNDGKRMREFFDFSEIQFNIS